MSEGLFRYVLAFVLISNCVLFSVKLDEEVEVTQDPKVYSKIGDMQAVLII